MEDGVKEQFSSASEEGVKMCGWGGEVGKVTEGSPSPCNNNPLLSLPSPGNQKKSIVQHYLFKAEQR